MSSGERKESVISARTPTYPIESVDNVLRLLILISERKQIRVSEAAISLGTAISTAHRLLAMLVHHEFVVQDSESKVYRSGPTLQRVGLLAIRGMEVRNLILPYLEQLREETGETVHAAVIRGSEMLFIACAESPNALRVASRVGTSMWAHCTSVGKAWLACESDDFLRGLYPSPKLPALTDRSLTSRAALLSELHEVRRMGFARNVGESEPGVGSVSVAIRQRDGRPLVAVSVSIPLIRAPEERWDDLVAHLRDVGSTVESALP